MTRFIVPIVLVVMAVALFFTFTTPLYNEVAALRLKQASYNEALNNSKALENERDKLTQKYNSIGVDNLDKIKKLLPENVDNIRLILEIEKIAAPFGMTLKDVRYNVVEKDKADAPSEIQGGRIAPGSGEYGAWDLEFSTTGTYDNLISFLKALESNLRIVDIDSIEFSSKEGSSTSTVATQAYQYRFKIKTYWLKD